MGLLYHVVCVHVYECVMYIVFIHTSSNGIVARVVPFIIKLKPYGDVDRCLQWLMCGDVDMK